MKPKATIQEANQNPTPTQIVIHRIYGKNQQFEVKGLPTQLQGTDDETWKAEGRVEEPAGAVNAPAYQFTASSHLWSKLRVCFC